MDKIKKFLLENKYCTMHESVLWNFVASAEYSFQSAILMFAVTRFIGLDVAGVFILAYTVTQMMVTIGNYGMRSFQVSDIQNEYSFHTYFSSRILTVFVMLGICMAYSWSQGYDRTRVFLISILCLYRAFESLEDVLHGELQKAQRLDVGAKIEAIRIFISTIVFLLCCIFTHDVIIACCAMTVCSFSLTVALNLLVLKNFAWISFRLESMGIFHLLVACFPICICDFFYNYLVNAPKYAIERNLSEASQAIFTILFMPVFIINMISSFIYKPIMTNIGILWNNYDYKKIVKTIIRQIITISFLTIAIIIVGNLIGLTLLGYIYGVSLNNYKGLFALLLCFGGFAAIDVFFVIILTIIRKQKWIIVAYVTAIACIWICMDSAVCSYGLWGAGIIYGMAMGIMMLILLFVTFYIFYKKSNSQLKN